jgi:hypothetical protein
MLLIIIQIFISVRETDDKISAVMFFIVSFLRDFRFHFGSVFKITNLK